MALQVYRRAFLKQAGLAFAATAIGFPSVIIPKPKEKLGVALVGLGRYSTSQLAPGLHQTQHCQLRGIVTGTPEKIPAWQARHRIPDRNVYNYDTLDDIANNDEIDVVYIVTPPGVHARDAVRAAEAGKHVWCEKPMAMNAEQCRAIINAAKKNRVHLSIGYRMQHEPNTQRIIRYGRERTYGAVRAVRTGAGYRGAYHDPTNWRRIGHLGGGALYDMGVYPINAARYVMGVEPIAVRGRQWSERKPMYSDVDEFTEFELEFPKGVVAKGEASFGKGTNYLRVTCTDGWYELSPFQSYTGVEGETSDGTRLPPDPHHQQARQMDNEALAIKMSSAPLVPGEEGLADIRIVNAIMESSRKGGARITL